MKERLTVDDKNKISVMHVAQSAGGVEQYLAMLLKYIDKEKYENILVCSQDFNKSKFKGLVSHFIVIDMKREIGFNDIKATIEVRKQIKKYKPDIVYAHSSKAGVIARLANFAMKNKSVYNPHGWAFNMRCSKIKKNIYALVERILSHFCNEIICISEAEKNSALKKHICSLKKIVVINNGIDIDQYKNSLNIRITRSDVGIPLNAIVIGTVGRLCEQKSPDIFIRVAKKIKEVLPNAFFIMVGDGEQKDMVLQYAKLHKFDKSLLITGWVDDPIKYIQLFDVATLLSRWEGFGLVLAEYMICGKPIVATNVDAIPYIVRDYQNGLVAKVDDIDSIYKLIIKIVNDKKMQLEFGKQGKKIVTEKYDIRRVAKEHDELFMKLFR